MKICLDPGHYGSTYNQSTQVAAYYESEMTWKLSQYLKEVLERKGFTVICTRQNQTEDVAVYQRGIMAEGCDLFLSLHSNACGTESVDYPIIYRAYDNKNQADTVALALSQKIAQLMGTEQEGKTGTRTTSSGTEYYGVMRGARAVNCPLYLLIEHSFHSNKNASLWLLEEENLRKLAEMEGAFFAELYGMEEAEDSSGLCKIMGESQVTALQMKQYLRSVNANATEYESLAEIFLREGAVEGVRGDIAFAQACLETGHFKFGGDVLAEQHNFCGLGATGNGEPGCRFDSMELGARAQIQHLHAYACDGLLYQVCVDPRYTYVERKTAEFVEWLGIQENPQGKGWAAGANYGEKILAILSAISEMKEESDQMSTVETGEEIIPDWMKSAVEWMAETGLMAGDGNGNYMVDQALTRGQFAVMLQAYHQKVISEMK